MPFMQLISMKELSVAVDPNGSIDLKPIHRLVKKCQRFKAMYKAGNVVLIRITVDVEVHKPSVVSPGQHSGDFESIPFGKPKYDCLSNSIIQKK